MDWGCSARCRRIKFEAVQAAAESKRRRCVGRWAEGVRSKAKAQGMVVEALAVAAWIPDVALFLLRILFHQSSVHVSLRALMSFLSKWRLIGSGLRSRGVKLMLAKLTQFVLVLCDWAFVVSQQLSRECENNLYGLYYIPLFPTKNQEVNGF